MRFNREVTEQWLQTAREFQSSGMTRSQYCKQKQVRPCQLDYWRRQLRKSLPPAPVAAARWIPLQIQNDPAMDHSSAIELRIGRVVIAVTPGFDRDLLAEVIRVVGAAC